MFGREFIDKNHRETFCLFWETVLIGGLLYWGSIVLDSDLFAMMTVIAIIAAGLMLVRYQILPVSKQIKAMILGRRAVRAAETNSQLQKLAALKSIALKDGQQPIWFGQATKWVDEHDSPQEAILLLEMLLDQARANLPGAGA